MSLQLTWEQGHQKVLTQPEIGLEIRFKSTWSWEPAWLVFFEGSVTAQVGGHSVLLSEHVILNDRNFSHDGVLKKDMYSNQPEMRFFLQPGSLVQIENARAQIRVMVNRILRKHGYPPDMQQRATDLVLEQTEVLCQEWGNT